MLVYALGVSFDSLAAFRCWFGEGENWNPEGVPEGGLSVL